MLAAEEGDTETVHDFLRKGADPHAKDNNGKTAVMLAEKKGHNDTVAALLKVKDANGKTALMLAAEEGDAGGGRHLRVRKDGPLAFLVRPH
jgi:ankyrin repeat protein